MHNFIWKLSYIGFVMRVEERDPAFFSRHSTNSPSETSNRVRSKSPCISIPAFAFGWPYSPRTKGESPPNVLKLHDTYWMHPQVLHPLPTDSLLAGAGPPCRLHTAHCYFQKPLVCCSRFRPQGIVFYNGSVWQDNRTRCIEPARCSHKGGPSPARLWSSAQYVFLALVCALSVEQRLPVLPRMRAAPVRISQCMLRICFYLWSPIRWWNQWILYLVAR